MKDINGVGIVGGDTVRIIVEGKVLDDGDNRYIVYPNENSYYLREGESEIITPEPGIGETYKSTTGEVFARTIYGWYLLTRTSAHSWETVIDCERGQKSLKL